MSNRPPRAQSGAINRRRLLPVLGLLFVSSTLAQVPPFMTETTVYDNPAVVLTNDKLELAVALKGGSMVRLLLRDDREQLNPYGNPERYKDASGKPLEVLGHFICVDGFGPVSAEERAAGLPMHGEAHLLPWHVVSSGKRDGVATVKFAVDLPLLQKALTRTIQMVDGENIFYVESELESHLAFDHPVNWGEHLTLGVPFLEPENLVVDISGSRSRTRDFAPQQSATRRLARDKEFTWPLAPLGNGGTVDLRPVPAKPATADHTTTLLDPSRKLVFVTALNTARQYLIGMVFRREEFPFIQTYEGYRAQPWMIRALEPATQPFDLPRRTSVQMNSMFDTLTYRWLPAKSKISSRFLEFYVKTPPGMSKIDDVRVEGGNIVIEDRKAGKQVTLKASLPL